MVDSDNVESIDAQLQHLRSNISDLGYQLDSYRTKTAGALGAGVFLMFLAALAGYDLAVGKGAAWSVLGITRESMVWIASGLALAAAILLLVGIRRLRMSDTEGPARLESMEREYAELLERRDAGAQPITGS